jgi:hypothetical protein
VSDRRGGRGSDDGDCPGHLGGAQADPVPRPERRVGRRQGIEQAHGGAAHQLPTTGRRLGVDAGETAGQSDRPAGHGGARRRSSGHRGEIGREPDEVGESGSEADEGDLEIGPGQETYDVRRRQTGQGGDLVEVGSVESDGDLDPPGGHPVGDGGRSGGQPLAQDGQVDDEGVDDDGDRPEADDHVLDTDLVVVADGGRQCVGLVDAVHLDDDGAVTECPQRTRRRHVTKDRSSTPAAVRELRTFRASSTAPGVSPGRQMDEASIGIHAPSTAATR